MLKFEYILNVQTYLAIHSLAVGPATLRVWRHQFINAAQRGEVGPVSGRSPAHVLWDGMFEWGLQKGNGVGRGRRNNGGGEKGPVMTSVRHACHSRRIYETRGRRASEIHHMTGRAARKRWQRKAGLFPNLDKV